MGHYEEHRNLDLSHIFRVILIKVNGLEAYIALAYACVCVREREREREREGGRGRGEMRNMYEILCGKPVGKEAI